jgi:C4-dicarboxylate transporter, DctM subunit
MQEFLIGLAAMLALMFARVPIALAMGLVGYAGLGLLRGWPASTASLTSTVYETALSYQLSVLPLFILMGNFVARARLSEEIFHAAYAFFGHIRGGLAMSTIVASAGFGAIGRSRPPPRSPRWPIRPCAISAIPTRSRPERSPRAERWAS